MRPHIGVIGGHDCTDREAKLAYDVGYGIGQAGAIVVTGGLGGVMHHASRGAVDAGSQAIGILPGSKPEDANEYVSVVIPTGMGELRNGLVVRASRALVAVGGSWGTLSELALARRTGIPIIGLASPYPETLEYPRTDDPAEAVAWALEQASHGA